MKRIFCLLLAAALCLGLCACGEKTQKYFVKVLFGEEKALGKNPVELKGFFEREV